MVEVGDVAPDFTVPMANGGVDEFTLSDRLDDGPVVLAFFPAAFTGTCATEMGRFRDRLDDFEGIGASVYGISVDTPFSLNEFRAQNDLNFPLLSDTTREVIDAYDVRMADPLVGVHGLAQRAVFVIDPDGRIAYRWVSDDPGVEPDYETVEAAAAAAAADA